MSSINNIRHPYKKYDYRRPNTFKDYAEQPIRCRECNKLIIGEYNFDTRQVISYEIENYPNKRIEHEHPADAVTRTDVMHRTAVEIRLLHTPDPGDYHYYVREGRVNAR